MIDRSRPEPQAPQTPLGIPIPGIAEGEPQSGAKAADLYEALFSGSGDSEVDSHGGKPTPEAPRDAAAAAAPPAPLTLRQTGLTLGTVTDLILKQLYLQGN